MIVCHCRVVRSGDIDQAVQNGARTVAEVCRRTGAARDCGVCVFSVRHVVCQHGHLTPLPTEEAVRAAS